MDIDLDDNFEALNEDKKRLRYHYTRLVKFINNPKYFLLDDGTYFFRLLANFRKYAIERVSPSVPENLPPVEGEQGARTGRVRSIFGIPAVVLSCVVAVCFTILGVAKVIPASSIVYGLVSIPALFFIPMAVILTVTRKKALNPEEKVESLFQYMKKEYEKSIFNAREVLRVKEEAISLGVTITGSAITTSLPEDLDNHVDNSDELEQEEDMLDSKGVVQDLDDKVKLPDKLPDPFHDALGTDVVRQSQFKLGAVFTTICGDILSVSESIYSERIESLVEKAMSASRANDNTPQGDM